MKNYFRNKELFAHWNEIYFQTHITNNDSKAMIIPNHLSSTVNLKWMSTLNWKKR